ncbi:MAG TPA: hypothetical protein VFL94_15970 [Actinomycetales bacterium]|nr:hypothetical protein [Actinomycetales bacterium]
MAADLLDRNATEGESLRLHRRTRVLRVFAARNRSGAWAYLDEVGWRKVSAPTPAAARDLLSALCQARLSGDAVTVALSGTGVVAVADDGSNGRVSLLPAPRFTGLTRQHHRRPTTLLRRA